MIIALSYPVLGFIAFYQVIGSMLSAASVKTALEYGGGLVWDMIRHQKYM